MCVSRINITQVIWFLLIFVLFSGLLSSFSTYVWEPLLFITWVLVGSMAHWFGHYCWLISNFWLRLLLLLLLIVMHFWLYQEKWLAWGKRVNPGFSVCQLRQDFRQCPLQQPKTVELHTHPLAARSRGDAAKLAVYLAKQRGLVPFSYQMSAADVRHGVFGSRQWFWGKDVMVTPTDNTIGLDHLVYAIDVDYYVDMNDWLSSLPDVPVMLHTFNPRSAAYVGKEYSFKFLPDGRVDYIVNEARYKHYVWNWNADVLSVGSAYFRRFYLVERRKADDHHDYVLLIPIGSWRGLLAILAHELVATPLRRLLPTTSGDFFRLDVKLESGLAVSVARFDTYNAATIPSDRMDTILAASRLTKLPYNLASVQGWLDGDKATSAVILDYVRNHVDLEGTYVSESIYGARQYQLMLHPSDYQDDCKPTMLPFARAIIPAGFVPDSSVNNEMMAVEGRIKIPTVDSELLMRDCPDHQLMCYFEEFVDCLFPKKGVVYPCDIEDVYGQQNRPTQRNLLDRADGLLWSSDLFKTFLKKEAYQKPSYPRIITTVNTSRKRDYARFILALAEHFKTFPWYAPGMTPKEIADCIAKNAQMLMALYCADAEKMDGHISGRVRLLERMILHAAFPQHFWSELDELHAAHYGKTAMTVLAIFYVVSNQRGSGENATTLFNTTVSKFDDYCARRVAGNGIKESYEAFGLFAGDDGIASFEKLSKNDIVQTASMVGQRLEVDVFLRGQHGVNFLSRVFTWHVWYGDPSSSCDLLRTLSKLHLTLDLEQFTPLEKLSQKLAGLLRTDSRTPVIRNLLAMAVRLDLNLQCDVDRRISTWFAHFPTESNWPNDYDFDAEDWVENYLPGCHLDDFLKHCAECTKDNCLLFPAIYEPKPPKIVATTVVDGIMEVAPSSLCHKFVRGDCRGVCSKQHVKACREFLDGRCKRRNCKFPHLK